MFSYLTIPSGVRSLLKSFNIPVLLAISRLSSYALEVKILEL